WNVDQDAIADAREGQAAGLIEPAAHRAGMAINLFGEGFEVEKVFEQVRHYCAPSVTVHDNLRTASAMSAKNNPVNSELLGRAFVVVLVLFEVGQRNVGRSVTKLAQLRMPPPTRGIGGRAFYAIASNGISDRGLR